MSILLLILYVYFSITQLFLIIRYSLTSLDQISPMEATQLSGRVFMMGKKPILYLSLIFGVMVTVLFFALLNDKTPMRTIISFNFFIIFTTTLNNFHYNIID